MARSKAVDWDSRSAASWSRPTADESGSRARRDAAARSRLRCRAQLKHQQGRANKLYMNTLMHDRSTVLYIEDNNDNQRLVKRILEARGYLVLLAPDGPDGIALARESRPVLILVDINIPGLDGYETTTRLR